MTFISDRQSQHHSAGGRYRHHALRRLAVIATTCALSSTLVAGATTPAAAATDETLAGATILSVSTDEAGDPQLGSARADGSALDPMTTRFVSNETRFTTHIGAEQLTSLPDTETGEPSTARIDLESFEVPEGASVVVTPEGSSDALLSTATDAPRSMHISESDSVPSTWAFSQHGEYRMTFSATIVSASAEEKSSTNVTLAFSITGETTAPASPADPVTPGTPVPPDPPISTPEPEKDEAAPAPGTRRVLSKLHTDAVSTFFDDGRIALDSRADVPEGLATRLDAETVFFNIEPDSLYPGGVPNLPGFDFLGDAGEPLWLAPQVADPDILWPGFSTEDPRLAGRLDGNTVNYELLSTVGPGSVEVFQITGASQPTRWFSSATALDPVAFDVPQHAHANWAFSAEGRYELTFRATATVGGVVQSATNTFVFHVGDIAASALTTAVSVSSATATADATVRLSARVRAQGDAGYVPTGWIELFQGDAGLSDPETLQGFTRVATLPLVDGRAVHDATLPATNAPVFIARFVPRFSNEFLGSDSDAFALLNPDTTPLDFDDLPGLGSAGDGITIAPPATAEAGGVVTVSARGRTAGDYISSWMYLDKNAPTWLGWTRLTSERTFDVRLPRSVSPGDYRLAAKADDDSFIGWDEFTVTTAGSTPLPVPPKPAPPVTGGPGAGDGAVAPPPAKACAPAVVLDHGHIDAFNISVHNSRLLLQVKEDVTGNQVVREAESVLLRVKESAWQSRIPAGYPGAPSGYVLPLTQDSNLIWPGWDTNRTSGSGYTDVSINVSSVSGPGRVSLYTLAGFGSVSSLLTSGKYSLPGTIREPKPVHTHAQWTFSSEGIYKLRVNAVATNPSTGATITSAAHTYVFQVGNVSVGSTFCAIGSGAASSASSADETLTDEQRAALLAAEAAALAAENADDAKANRSGTDSLAESNADSANPLDQLFRGNAPAQLYAVLAGGLLLVLAIAGGTWWILRRRAADAS